MEKESPISWGEETGTHSQQCQCWVCRTAGEALLGGAFCCPELGELHPLYPTDPQNRKGQMKRGWPPGQARGFQLRLLTAASEEPLGEGAPPDPESYHPPFPHRGGVPGPCYGSTASGHWLLSRPAPASPRPQLGASEDPKRTSQTPCGHERTINRSRHCCLRVSCAAWGTVTGVSTPLALGWET